jgi:HlyD family secretion protein
MEKQSLKNFALWILALLLLTACHRASDTWQGYVENNLVYLSSNSDGFLQTLPVDRGTPVKAGQTLFVLESQPEAYQVLQAQQKLQQAQFDLSNLIKGQRYTILQGIQSQLSQAQADLTLAKITYERNQELLQTHVIAKAQYDQAKADYERAVGHLNELMANLDEAKLGARTDVIASAQAALDAAQTQANLAAWYLTKKTITAPKDGQVFDTYFSIGEWVPAGRPVASILVPTDTKVVFYVSELVLSQIKYGQTVRISMDGSKQTYLAKINFISPTAEYTPPTIFSEKERRKFVYRVEAKGDPAVMALLHPGQPVDVTLLPDAELPKPNKL